MKKKWFWTLFGGRTAYNVPNFVIQPFTSSPSGLFISAHSAIILNINH